MSIGNGKLVLIGIIIAVSIVGIVFSSGVIPDETIDKFSTQILTYVAVFTAVGSAIGLVISHYQTGVQMKQESDAKFLEITEKYTESLVKYFEEGFTIEDYDHEHGIDNDANTLQANVVDAKEKLDATDENDPELQEVAKAELYQAENAVIKQREACVNWAFKYVDNLDMLSYIKKKNAIPEKLTNYFGPGWFGMAKSLMVWHDVVVTRKDDPAKITNEEERDKVRIITKEGNEIVTKRPDKFKQFRPAIETWPHVYEHCFKKDNDNENKVPYVPREEFPDVLVKHFPIENDTLRDESKNKEY